VARRRSFLFKFFLILLIAAGLVGVSSPLWLRAMGSALIRNDGPARADLAVVLGGDFNGDRILKAAQLVREGYVPAALISGPAGFFGQHECDFAINFAVHHGYPSEWFVPYPAEVHSTRDEARTILGDLHRRGDVHKILLVTSDYHTGRAGRLFQAAEQKLGGGIEIRVIAVPDRNFHADSWWTSREGQKVAFGEWLKVVTSAFGI
jgi:uncharacterized SAM-binding protein YcdF (DUF218 family)